MCNVVEADQLFVYALLKPWRANIAASFDCQTSQTGFRADLSGQSNRDLKPRLLENKHVGYVKRVGCALFALWTSAQVISPARKARPAPGCTGLGTELPWRAKHTPSTIVEASCWALQVTAFVDDHLQHSRLLELEHPSVDGAGH